MRYGLLPLLGLVSACAVLFTFSLRPDSTAAELRRDLQIPATSQVWLISDAKPDRVIAISETDGAYNLFSAARIPVDSDRPGRWSISFTLLDVPPAPHRFKYTNHTRPNLKGPDVAQSYDHFPTEDEIAAFLVSHRIDWAL